MLNNLFSKDSLFAVGASEMRVKAISHSEMPTSLRLVLMVFFQDNVSIFL